MSHIGQRLLLVLEAVDQPLVRRVLGPNDLDGHLLVDFPHSLSSVHRAVAAFSGHLADHIAANLTTDHRVDWLEPGK